MFKKVNSLTASTKQSYTSTALPSWYMSAAYALAGITAVVVLFSWLSSSDQSVKVKEVPAPAVVVNNPSIAIPDNLTAVTLAGQEDTYILVSDVQVSEQAVQLARRVVQALYSGVSTDIPVYSGFSFPATSNVWVNTVISEPVSVSTQPDGSYVISFNVDPDGPGAEYQVTQSVTVAKDGEIWAYLP